METQLDPSIVSLAKAIGKTESGGNYNAPIGGAGETGAYQMTPGFIANNAPKYLKGYTPSQSLNPTQQDELAYNVLKDWGTKEKLTPAQAVSRWNTGDENAYLDPQYGRNNSYGSTEKYVSAVEKNYTPSQPNQLNIQNQPQPSFEDQVRNFVMGTGAAIGSYVGSHAGAIANTATGIGITGAGIASGNPLLIGSGLLDVGTSAKGLFTSNSPKSSGQDAPSYQPRSVSSTLQSLSIGEADKNSGRLSDLITQSLGTTIGNRQQLQDTNVQAGIKTMGMFGLAPDIDKNGSQDWSKSMKKTKEMVANLSEQIQSIIAGEGSKGSFKRVGSEAKKMVRERLPEYEWGKADEHIDQTVNAYNRHKNDSAGLEVFHKMRHDTGGGAKWGILDSSTKREAFKALSRASRKEVELNTKNPELYNAVMKMEQNLINSQHIMKRLNGKKGVQKEGLLKAMLHGAGNVAGAYIGDKIGGTMGALIGYLVENNVSRAVEKRLGRTVFETPGMKRALRKLQADSPEYYKFLMKKLEAVNPVIEDKIDDLETTTANTPTKTPLKKGVKAPEKALMQ